MVALKGLGKAYEMYNKIKKAGVVKDTAKMGDVKKIVQDGNYQKLKKAGVVKDTAKMGDIQKILQSEKTKPSETSKITSQKMGGKASQAGSAPTKGKLEFGKGSKGELSVKPSGKKTLTKEYLKKLEIKKNLSKK